MNWLELHENVKIPDVFILNLDIAGSTKISSVSHPAEHQSRMKELHGRIDNLFAEDKRFYSDSWTGDGLVVLFSDNNDVADDLIGKAIEILLIEKPESNKSFFPEPVSIRVGIAMGNIYFSRDIGDIICEPMNIAGKLQKACPDDGGVLINENVMNYIKDKKLLNGFQYKEVLINNKTHICNFLSIDASKVYPKRLGQHNKVEINVQELYGNYPDAKADAKKINEYLKKAKMIAGPFPPNTKKEVVLTGRGPIWLYLVLAREFHGVAAKLVYSSPKEEDVVIYDHVS